MASAPPILITPKFVFSYPLSPNVSDYRCVVNADATAVIVERTVLGAGGEQPNLYIADLLGGSATPFLKSINTYRSAKRRGPTGVGEQGRSPSTTRSRQKWGLSTRPAPTPDFSPTPRP